MRATRAQQQQTKNIANMHWPFVTDNNLFIAFAASICRNNVPMLLVPINQHDYECCSIYIEALCIVCALSHVATKYIYGGKLLSAGAFLHINIYMYASMCAVYDDVLFHSVVDDSIYLKMPWCASSMHSHTQTHTHRHTPKPLPSKSTNGLMMCYYMFIVRYEFFISFAVILHSIFVFI